MLGGDQPELPLEVLSPRIAAALPVTIASGGAGGGILRERLRAAEAEILRDGLVRHRWNLQHLADELQIPTAMLTQKCALHGLAVTVPGATA